MFLLLAKSCRILNDLQAQNGGQLSSIQDKLSERPDLLTIMGQLANMVNKELIKNASNTPAVSALQRARSAERAGGSSTNCASPLRHRQSSIRAADESEVLTNLRRKLAESNLDMERIRNEMLGMSREMDAKDDLIRNLERRINESSCRPGFESEEVMMLRRDNQGLVQEARMLKDHIASL